MKFQQSSKQRRAFKRERDLQFKRAKRAKVQGRKQFRFQKEAA